MLQTTKTQLKEYLIEKTLLADDSYEFIKIQSFTLIKNQQEKLI